MLEATFRPLATWPYAETRDQRWRPFKASWTDTLDLLRREIEQLRDWQQYDQGIIIACGLRERDIRNDGWPRSGAPEPAFPGVEVSFDSRHGRIVFATDCCSHWEDNVRSIALGLEALRAVDRYGVSKRGQQYAGWKALPMPVEGQVASPREVLEAYAHDPKDAEHTPTFIAELDNEALYRLARKRTHPDHGGRHEDFVNVTKAWDALEAEVA